MSNTKHSRNLGCALKIMVITNYLISTIWRMAVDFFSLRHMKQQSRKLINIIRAIKMLTLLRNSKMKRAWVSSCPYLSIHLKCGTVLPAFLRSSIRLAHPPLTRSNRLSNTGQITMSKHIHPCSSFKSSQDLIEFIIELHNWHYLQRKRFKIKGKWEETLNFGWASFIL